MLKKDTLYKLLTKISVLFSNFDVGCGSKLNYVTQSYSKQRQSTAKRNINNYFKNNQQ